MSGQELRLGQRSEVVGSHPDTSPNPTCVDLADLLVLSLSACWEVCQGGRFAILSSFVFRICKKFPLFHFSFNSLFTLFLFLSFLFADHAHTHIHTHTITH